MLASTFYKDVIFKFHDLVQQQQVLDLETYKQIVEQIKGETGHTGQHLFHPIRVALTGQSSGFELDRLIPILQQGNQLDLPEKILSAKDRVRLVRDYLR